MVYINPFWMFLFTISLVCPGSEQFASVVRQVAPLHSLQMDTRPPGQFLPANANTASQVVSTGRQGSLCSKGLAGGPIQHCVSLGPSCHAAEFLRGQRLTRYSTPFDWVHSSPEIVSFCLKDGCEALLNRRDLEGVAAARDTSGSAPTPKRERRGMHRRFRTAEHAHIFQHHDPSSNDLDFAKLHREADRLRRVLEDGDSRTLFFHLETNASAGDTSRSAFVEDAQAMFASLCDCSSNFALLAIRAVPIASCSGTSGESELLEEHRDLERQLLILELTTCTSTVVPLPRISPQGTPEELEADVAALAASLQSRFDFELRQEPPPRTTATDAMRLRVGPHWLWQHPSKQGPSLRPSAAELRQAAALLPGACHAPDAMLAMRAAEEGADEHTEVPVAAYAKELVLAMGDSMSVREWEREAKRLATPNRRSPTREALVAAVLGYQCSENRAEAERAVEFRDTNGG